MSHTVAVYGLNGLLGIHVINALLSEPFVSKIKTPIKLITHSAKRIVESDKVEYVDINQVGLKKAFEGVDAVVNLANFPHGANQDVIDAVVEDNVKLYIPSQFGTDIVAAQKTFPGFLQPKVDHSNAARAAGVKTVDIITSLFVAPDQLFMGHPLSILNFDSEKNEVEIVGDESTPINPSFLNDIGKVVAALVTKDDYSSIPDTVRVYSGKVTLGDLVEHYNKTHNTSLNKKYVKPETVIEQAKNTPFSFEHFVLYLRAILAGGEGNGNIFETENDREFVNPDESLFKWTKYTI